MDNIRIGVVIIVLFISQVCTSQSTDELMLYRKDFKEAKSAEFTTSITSFEKDGSHYIYTGGWGAINVFSLNKEGKLNHLSNHEIIQEVKIGPARGLVIDNFNGNDFLFVANTNNNLIESFKILDNGSLQRVAIIKDTDETHLGNAIALQIVHMKTASYLFAGGLEDTAGLSSFKIHNNGKLTHVYSINDDNKMHTSGIVEMDIHIINGKTFLYTSGFYDGGISSFEVRENGEFKNINNIDDNTTDRFLTGAYSVTSVAFGKTRYIIAGHRHHKYYSDKYLKRTDYVYHGEAVSVFKVNNKGALVPHSILKDDETTKLKGQTGIEIISTNSNEAILAIASRDETSIQLCKLSKEGVLSPINYLSIGFTIYSGFRHHKIDDADFLIAGSPRFDLKKIVSYQVSPRINRDGKTLQYTVNLTYKKGASVAQINEAVETFINLKKEIPEISDIEWKINDSIEVLTHTFTLLFNDENARETYLFHEEHMKLVNLVKPIIADVSVSDNWIEAY